MPLRANARSRPRTIVVLPLEERGAEITRPRAWVGGVIAVLSPDMRFARRGGRDRKAGDEPRSPRPRQPRLRQHRPAEADPSAALWLDDRSVRDGCDAGGLRGAV